jgi:hypothetical protein
MPSAACCVNTVMRFPATLTIRCPGERISVGCSAIWSSGQWRIQGFIDSSAQTRSIHSSYHEISSRFISSDPIDPQQLPRDIIETVIAMKSWIVKTLKVLARDRVDGDDLVRLADVALGYLDGEVFNLINGRVLPGEDVAGRVIDNLERVFTLLTANNHDGLELSDEGPEAGWIPFPALQVRS